MSSPAKSTGHPKGLMTLFFSEMWERFCYYGMRTLLTLYLVKSLMKGDAEASLLYGAYTGLVYAAPILGGRMADQFLGYRLAVIFGAILMALGEFLILGGNETFLLIGMGALIVGNGYFKANISTIVGKLYEDGDPRRDSGFTIFYIGINVGALLATTVVAYVGETYGFEKGFALAGFGMLVGMLIFWFGRNNYEAAAGLDVTEEGKKSLFGPITRAQGVMIGSLALIPLCYVLILNNSWLNLIFLGLFIYVTYVLISAGIKEDRVKSTSIWKDRMIALVLFMVINIVFWACFEQAGTSLTLFADRSVDRNIFGWEMPASMTQFFNPAFIIIFGSIFSMMWVQLTKIGKNPSIPMKFALGILQLGFGFLITYIGYTFAEGNLVPLFTLVFLYMLHTTGELFLSPIGLSMVTKLSPKTMAGTAMGAWFLSFAIANLLGGQIATLTGGGHGGGDETEESEFTSSTTVKEAFTLLGSEDGFENWESLSEGVEDIHKDNKLGVNITYGKWLELQDWVELREGLDEGQSFSDWKSEKGARTSYDNAKDWLNEKNWNDLSDRYIKISRADFKLMENDDATEKPGFSVDDWRYFGSGIDDLNADATDSLEDAVAKQKNIVQETQLKIYVDVFTILGFVLIGISILLMLLSKPLKKLMHGVE